MMLSPIHNLYHTLLSRRACQLCGFSPTQTHRLCDDCWTMLPWKSPSLIHRHERNIYACFDYSFPIDRIIHLFKYEQQLHYQTFLAHTLLELKLKRFQAIVPMPISNERLKERGYNQMMVIGKILSKKLQIPIWQPIERSAQHSQKGLTRVERIEDIQSQFKPIRSEKGKFRNILIIDDVVTTGSSVNALANALEKLGCQNIQIACIAAAEY